VRSGADDQEGDHGVIAVRARHLQAEPAVDLDRRRVRHDRGLAAARSAIERTT
jgi:hypothetical protein